MIEKIKMSWTMERIQTLRDRAEKSGYKIDPDQDLVKAVNWTNGYVILNEMINEKKSHIPILSMQML